MDEVTFCDFLKSVNQVYKRSCNVYYRLAAHYGFTETMFDILYFVRENEDCFTQAQICSNLYLRKQTVNSALKKLERDGYIYLTHGETNHKNKIIRFTEKGENMVRETIDPIFEVERKAFEALSLEERTGIMHYGLRHMEVLEQQTDAFLKREEDKKKELLDYAD